MSYFNLVFGDSILETPGEHERKMFSLKSFGNPSSLFAFSEVSLDVSSLYMSHRNETG